MDRSIADLTKELKQSKFRFGSIYEFSDSLYSSFELDHIFRVFFSTIMGQLGITKLFFFDLKNNVFRKRGFRIDEQEKELVNDEFKNIKEIFFVKTVNDIEEESIALKEILDKKKIYYIIDLSLSKKREIYLGLGKRFNRIELTKEEIEYAFFLSKFTITALDNSFMVEKIIESKQVEREMNIAKDIQLSLLPQALPLLKNFEISVIYRPLNEVGGDYYDMLNTHENKTSVLVADVEGKGLSAALLGASSQAVFHSMNEFCTDKPSKFIEKANTLIHDLTKGKRFITLFWMIVDDDNKSVKYVNAGHIEPLLISNNKTIKLSKGGFLTGFISNSKYEEGVIELKSNDVIAIFTDGAPEVESPDEEEYGIERLTAFLKKNYKLSASKITEKFQKEIDEFSKGTPYRDDFTFLILKVK
jgi:sigma-B regulation protein RsbU (phosphoserine phosphatase)